VPAPKKRVSESLQLRIVVVDPPPNITWALQLGQVELVKPTSSTKSRICFDFTLEVVPESSSPGFRLKGPAVQGRLGERFVYLRIGAYAGQGDTTIARRAKISLEGIDRKLIAASKAKRGGVLEVQFAGTDSRGGPACATVRPLGKGWRVA
jgi:hypothetical protein